MLLDSVIRGSRRLLTGGTYRSSSGSSSGIGAGCGIGRGRGRGLGVGIGAGSGSGSGIGSGLRCGTVRGRFGRYGIRAPSLIRVS